MAEALSLTLDQLIEKNSAGRSKEGQKSRGKVVRSGRGNGKQQFSDRPKTARSNKSFLSRDVDDNVKTENRSGNRPTSAPKLIYRPIKVISQNNHASLPAPTQRLLSQPSVTAAPPKSSSVFARLGTPQPSGTKVIFSSLVSSVEPNDMEELCKTVGEIKDIVIKANWAGNKSAEVLFARRSDAISCVAKFNGLTLDGIPMVVELAEGAEPAAVPAAVPRTIFDRITTPSATFSTASSSFISSTATSHSAPKNNREGLFGTAIVEEEDQYEMQQEPRTSSATSTTFSVTLGSRVGSSAASGGVPKYPGRAVVAVGGGGRAKTAAGGFRAKNNNGGSNVGRTVGKTEGKDMDLDADLDAYMVKR
eukprot:CAMPEP_0201097682 /NCGR_PEP_ID=MMETSP0812-20130820/6732_1 /ASSEMBLY_ACC=CAM_ASM_000668 /TAXON_ID=98059 /ORGANISM="Dinobryon sp., Strain UTEXLB2267" /LENGTH=362 /DNA_ID=CAMNT_0047352719 /DNA_START=8 /DNA_END=1096 /DNA_ORIENTATION=-